MLSPKLRNKVHSLWTMFWSAGMTNPLVAIEQITYLLFLRQLERFDAARTKADPPKESIYYKDEKAKKDYNQCRWSYIRQDPSFKLFNDTVFPWLRGLEKWLKENSPANHDPLMHVTGRLDDAYFILDPNKTDTLERAVKAIDELFAQLDGHSANADIMGDIFEYLLGEIQSAGKNGQFRTPRHIIRFMVEMLDPPAGSRVLDPASGTGGFLVNTLLHWRKQATDPGTLRIEWDGTPHRTYGMLSKRVDLNECFVGFDNDRTMVRIAWMNLILHELDFPRIEQRDSLSKRMPDDLSDSFDFILANPPFTGSVDEGDLSTNRNRVPSSGHKDKPITTKSELLFVWLMLDLLRTGGRCAVVVPDGVLFGSTNAHRELRRQLLFENTLEAVVSLPGGVFLPYAGVKTSILIFQKVSQKAVAGQEPRTREVWFYDVADEAFTLDQKRKERFQGPNDLYDAVAKFRLWHEVLQGSDAPGLREAAVTTAYHQPQYSLERWRVLDDEFLRIFPEESSQAGHALGIHEVFKALPRDPAKATEKVKAEALDLFTKLTRQFVNDAHGIGATEKSTQKKTDRAKEELDVRLRKLSNDLNRVNREHGILDREFDQFGFTAMRETWEEAKANARASLDQRQRDGGKPKKPSGYDVPDDELQTLLKGFARMDGYDLWLRSVEPERQDKKDDKEQQLAWTTPVRAWAKLDSWGRDPQTGEETAKPTHDAEGNVDPEYLKFLTERMNVFSDDGTVKEDFRDRLDPDCIEAADLNLSAGRHKPFVFEAGDHEKPAALVKKLDVVHADIRTKLANLLAMVEGKA
ncbi:MAG: class I SAM-dependent DNA methyltransferase [Planctomycetaceae bacterium]|nr:type I restriction-modification system subunit M [Planctomycetaceae bacterium]